MSAQTRRIAGFHLVATLVASTALADPAITPEPAPATPTLTAMDVNAWLDGFLPFALERSDVAGAVVIVIKDGEILAQKGYGYADVAAKTPVDPARTLFRIGSVTKLLTWTAVMQLVETGKLDLDADVNTYLDFIIPPRDGKPVTLRNLMTHTGGFEEVVRNLLVDDPELLLPLEEFIKSSLPRRMFAPGKVPAYSNYGAALAGYIVQRVSGEPFDDYIEHHVLGPLGMSHTTTRQPLPSAFAKDMAQGYKLGSGPTFPFELIGPAPAGSAAATGADMGRFMTAYLQEGQLGANRILKPATVQQMFTTALPIIPPLNSMLLGFYEQDLKGRRILGHDGDSQYFHSLLSLFPDEHVGVFFSINSSGNEMALLDLRTALLSEFADRYFPVATDARAIDPQTAIEHAQLMRGTYKSSRRAQTSFIFLASLLSQFKTATGPAGELVVPPLTGLDGQPLQWREIAPFVWQSRDGTERLAAALEDGRVVTFSIDSTSPFVVFQRVAWWESSAWLGPLAVIGVAAILLTTLSWPAAWLIRRRYGATFALSGAAAKAHRLVRFGGIGVLIATACWIAVISFMQTNLAWFSPRHDALLLLLRIGTLAFAVGSTAIALWNAWLAWRSGHGWAARSWSIVLVVSFATLLWVALACHLTTLGVRY